MTNEMLSGKVTLEEMKDKFLIQKDILPGYNLEKLKGLRRDGELNHGIRECKTGGWEAKPWGLDGLVLYMNYDEQTKTGWYEVQCRFRLSGDIVLRLVGVEVRVGRSSIYTEVIEADSKEEFLKIMQESIDSSWLYLPPDINMYNITFREMNYEVGVFYDEVGLHADFSASGFGGDRNGNIISINPIVVTTSVAQEGIILCGFLCGRDERTYQGALIAN